MTLLQFFKDLNSKNHLQFIPPLICYFLAALFHQLEETSKTGMRNFLTQTHQLRIFPSFLLTIWIVLMSKWRHNTISPLTAWPHQQEIDSGSTSVSKGHSYLVPHIKANWKLQLWGEIIIYFMTWSKRRTPLNQGILTAISLLYIVKERTEKAIVTSERDALSSWRCQKAEGQFEEPKEITKREEACAHLV